MTSLNDLKRTYGEASDIANAVGQLTEFITIITTGTACGGNPLTIGLIIKESAKTVGALSKAIKALLGDDVRPQVTINQAERAGEIFYVLAQRAYIKAIINSESQIKSSAKSPDLNKHKLLIKNIQNSIVSPDRAEAYFCFGWNEASGNIQLFESYSKWLTPLLNSMSLDSEQVTKHVEKIEKEAKQILHQELVDRTKERGWMVDYQLLETTSSILDIVRKFPDLQRTAVKNSWATYLTDLSLKPSVPLSGEEKTGLSISKLFIEPEYEYQWAVPNGDFVKGNPAREVPLKKFLLGLMSDRRPSTEMVFVMGGPGTGKTSLMEMFCSELAETNSINVILVPAKRLDPQKAILPEVQKYLHANGHGALAEIFPFSDDCILAIDGFDELAHATLSTLDRFFRDALELVRERASNRLRILISGRPTLFSTNDVAIPSGSHVVTISPFSLLKVRQWTEKWRTATGGTFDGSLYYNSNSPDIREISAQPMLLYLLASMHENNEALPSNIIEGNGIRYKIYKEILDWVCIRQEGKRLETALTAKLRRFLQVAGLATHHSGQRTLHFSRFKFALEKTGLVNDSNLLGANISSAILSFSFTNLPDMNSWEFAHKSFGEALAAEAIGRVLDDISEPGRDGEPWRQPLPSAVSLWIDTFGPSFLTKDIIDFCEGLIYSKDHSSTVLLLQRLILMLHPLFQHFSVGAIGTVTKYFEISVPHCIGNATRSWFDITGTCLKVLTTSKGFDSTSDFRASIPM